MLLVHHVEAALQLRLERGVQVSIEPMCVACTDAGKWKTGIGVQGLCCTQLSLMNIYGAQRSVLRITTCKHMTS